MKNICDWNNCSKEGLYKAPIEKDNSKKFRMLCLYHVKEFNKNWNYFDGMNDSQICERSQSCSHLINTFRVSSNREVARLLTSGVPSNFFR